MSLRAVWIRTISQSDWLECRMYLIPAVADSSAADSIKSVSCFLTRTGCNVKTENPSLDLRHIYTWNYVLQKNTDTHVSIFAFFQNTSQAVYLHNAVKPLQELLRASLAASWVVSQCLCDFLWLLSL